MSSAHFLGNRQSETRTANGNTQSTSTASFTYDGYNRLISSQTAAETTTYTYNALGQRIKKINQNGLATSFHYGLNGELLYEQDQAGNTKVYVWLDGRPLARIDNNQQIYYYHVDHLGTPQAMTDSSGTVVWKGYYEPFGSATVRPISTIENNLRLPGQYYDRETGMQYNYFRDYDPTTGRYVEADPIGLEGGMNIYGYVGGNPLSNIDPEGLWSVTIGAFPGVGAQITFGQNPNGSGFMSGQFGWGIGGGFTYNPLGQQPGYDECQGASWGVGTGVYGQAGFRAGPVGASVGTNLGRNFRATGSELYGGLTKTSGLKDQISGISASVSGGGQITVFGGGTAKGRCTCGR